MFKILVKPVLVGADELGDAGDGLALVGDGLLVLGALGLEFELPEVHDDGSHLVDVELFLFGEAEDVEGLVREKHVLFVVDGFYADLALRHEVVVFDVVRQGTFRCEQKR